MADSTGLVIAAGAIVAANEALSAKSITDFNWRIVPATAVMAIVLAGIETAAPAFGKGLAGLVLLSVLVIPYGNAPTPLENLSNIMGYTKKVA
jgi:hypothetical protein